MNVPRPVLVGLQRIRGVQPARVEHDLLVLRAFAEREGYELASVYTCIAGDHGALELLIAHARRGEVSAVGVPSEADLGETARERRRAREQIEGAGVPVLVAQILLKGPCPERWEGATPVKGEHDMPEPMGRHGDPPRSRARPLRSIRQGVVGLGPRRLSGRRRALTDPAEAARTLLPAPADPIPAVHTPAVAPNREPGVWSADGRLLIEAVAVNRRATELQVRVRLDQVDVVRGGYVEACFDRVVLSSWIGDLVSGVTVEDLTCDDVTLTAGPLGRMALSVTEGLGRPAIERWELSPAEFAALHARI